MRRLGLSPGQMVSSLRQRNYRLFFSGQLVSVAGTWMQSVAQSFLVLDLACATCGARRNCSSRSS